MTQENYPTITESHVERIVRPSYDPPARISVITQDDDDSATTEQKVTFARSSTVYHHHYHSHWHTGAMTYADPRQHLYQPSPAGASEDQPSVAIDQNQKGLVRLSIVLRSAGLLIIAFVLVCALGNLSSRTIILDPVVAIAVFVAGGTFTLMSFARDPSKSPVNSQSTDMTL